MSDSIKTARTIDINNISVHLNDNEKNIEIVAEYEKFDYKSVIFPVSDWEAVKSAIEDLLTNGGTDEFNNARQVAYGYNVQAESLTDSNAPPDNDSDSYVQEYPDYFIFTNKKTGKETKVDK